MAGEVLAAAPVVGQCATLLTSSVSTLTSNRLSLHCRATVQRPPYGRARASCHQLPRRSPALKGSGRIHHAAKANAEYRVGSST
jgi:hypothetical protein